MATHYISETNNTTQHNQHYLTFPKHHQTPTINQVNPWGARLNPCGWCLRWRNS